MVKVMWFEANENNQMMKTYKYFFMYESKNLDQLCKNLTITSFWYLEFLSSYLKVPEQCSTYFLCHSEHFETEKFSLPDEPEKSSHF